MKVSTALYQKQSDGVFDLDKIEKAVGKGFDFVCLPEYCFIPPDARSQVDTALDLKKNLETLAELSERLDTVLVGGSVVEEENGKFYNVCNAFDCGRLVGKYRKVNLYRREAGKGISTGNRYEVFEIGGLRVGLLICADVLFPESYRKLAESKPDIIFVPTTSPYRADDTIEAKEERDSDYFLAGAKTASSYVAKCCAVGSLLGGRLQGRSLLAAPWGILKRAPFQEEDRELVLTAELDLEELKNHRRSEREAKI
ncbi:MAG: carbon-nitrogen hydrolase family protein [candidate division Zixibacteria bacterium]|nr:carbon-nitrogen hydrolase family protein [candidate division Zixibacteria bacterium]MCI0595211.1 carbon-nitrogen hydrolase family protein [candidate division Zixibacteria bacterium]